MDWIEIIIENSKRNKTVTTNNSLMYLFLCEWLTLIVWISSLWNKPWACAPEVHFALLSCKMPWVRERHVELKRDIKYRIRIAITQRAHFISGISLIITHLVHFINNEWIQFMFSCLIGTASSLVSSKVSSKVSFKFASHDIARDGLLRGIFFSPCKT